MRVRYTAPVKFAPLLLAALLAGCASGLPEPAAGVNCDDLTGVYELDPKACTISGGLLRVPDRLVKTLPDDSMLDPDNAVKLEILQTACDVMKIQVHENWMELAGVWDDNHFVHEIRGKSNLPPPIVLASHGGHAWEFRADGSGLVYTHRYFEGGLFFFMPFSAHRELTCNLKRVKK